MLNEKIMFIGEVVKRLSIHEQTIRDYERKGFLKLQRTPNKTRIFRESDITRINIIITLTQEMGLNLSGVKLIFALSKNFKMTDDELLDFVYEYKNDFINSRQRYE